MRVTVVSIQKRLRVKRGGAFFYKMTSGYFFGEKSDLTFVRGPRLEFLRKQGC